MADILQSIIADKATEIGRLQAAVSVDDLYATAVAHEPVSFREGIEHTGHGIIAEFKRRSPSKGWIHRDADPVAVAPGYEREGTSAMSVLTDEKYFGGTLDDFRRVRSVTKLPLLRKDFVISEYQLHQAKAAGADAVLLIAAAISEDLCRRLAHIARSLGLETLLEIHSEEELSYLSDDITVIGVNNRCLGTFQTSLEASRYLAARLPRSVTRISESGIHSATDVVELMRAGYNGFLIGELLMREPDPPAALRALNKDITSLICNNQ